MVLDAIARRYGRLPHEVAALSPEQLALATEALSAGRAEANRRAMIASRDTPVIPICDVAG